MYNKNQNNKNNNQALDSLTLPRKVNTWSYRKITNKIKYMI